jgi:hypothetical protein
LLGLKLWLEKFIYEGQWCLLGTLNLWITSLGWAFPILCISKNGEEGVRGSCKLFHIDVVSWHSQRARWAIKGCFHSGIYVHLQILCREVTFYLLDEQVKVTWTMSSRRRNLSHPLMTAQPQNSIRLWLSSVIQLGAWFSFPSLAASSHLTAINIPWNNPLCLANANITEIGLFLALLFL